MRRAEDDLQICERATPGPWPVVKSEQAPGRATLGEGLIEAPDRDSLMREEDAEFISSAREALPWWIRRAEELERENRELRERMNRLTLETE